MTRPHELRSTGMVAFFGAEPADDGQSITHPSESGKMLTDAQIGRWRLDFLKRTSVFMTGLQVERIRLTRATGHPQQDDTPFSLRVGFERAR